MIWFGVCFLSAGPWVSWWFAGQRFYAATCRVGASVHPAPATTFTEPKGPAHAGPLAFVANPISAVNAPSKPTTGWPSWSAPRKVVLPEVWLASHVEDAGMPQKKHKPEQIVAKLRQVDVLVSQGQLVAEAVRSISVTQFT